MGRNRLPQAKGSAYITPQGAQRLREELDHLWRVKRPQVTQAVSEAAAQGDRSENAEYIYGKKQLREIDRRIRFLQKRLDVLKIVDRPPTDASRVYFGAWVRLESETGETWRNIASWGRMNPTFTKALSASTRRWLGPCSRKPRTMK